MCEILSRSNLAVKSYGPDMDFRYMCTATLTLEIWPLVKVMTHPWAMDNNCVKYYPDPTWQWGVMARIQISSMCALTLGQGRDSPLGHGQQLCEIISRSDKGVQSYGLETLWTDRQTGWFLHVYMCDSPNFVCRGYKYAHAINQVWNLQDKLALINLSQFCTC